MDKNTIIANIELQIETIDETLALLNVIEKNAKDIEVIQTNRDAFKKLIIARNSLLNSLASLGQGGDRLFAQMIKGDMLSKKHEELVNKPTITCVTKNVSTCPLANDDCFVGSDELSK